MFESSCFPKDDTHPILYSSNKIKKGKKINKRQKIEKKKCFDGEEHNFISPHCDDGVWGI